MINSIKSYEDIIRNLRAHIITQCQVLPEHVVNLDSVRGADLQKILDNVDVMSINLNDVFITFELLENNNDDNYIIREENGSTSSISSYQFKLHIYGNMSHYVSQLIMTRMRDEFILTDLHEKGIYLSGIEYPENVKEFINNTLWPRCDVSINIQVRYNIESLTNDSYFNSNQKINDLYVEKI